jgi:ERF superfamily
MSEIAPRRRKAAMVPIAQPVADTLLNFVAQAVRDPSIEVTKLDALLRMQREIVADDARLQFNRAMSEAQAEMLPVLRDAQNTETRSRYARLETIDAIVRPIYTRHGFSLEFNSEPIDGPNVRVVCEVSHVAGHSKKFHLDAALDTVGFKGTANKTPLHGLGSSVTYLRRYLVCMVFNIVLANEDNDGNRERDTGEVISRPQLAELRALLADCSADPRAAKTNERNFLGKMGLDQLRSLADARPGQFAGLRTALMTKRANVLARRAAQTGEAA